MSDEIINIELDDELDLHPFHPKDVKIILKEFIDMAIEKGITEVRIIHGKGRSTIKGIVLRELEKNGKVISFKDDAGNWGASTAVLKKEKH